MNRFYYQEQALEGIARRVLTSYNPALYYGEPTAIPIEDLIAAHGLYIRYEYLRNNGRVLGETVFDDGLMPIYDMDEHQYILIPVKAKTVFIDGSLLEDGDCGRLFFTYAHELSHWILHKRLYIGTGENAAFTPAIKDTDMEVQANMLGSALLMPMPQVKRCYYRLRSGRDAKGLVADMADVFQVSRQAMRIRLENHNLI